MYRKDANSWLKHIDFILFDMVCLQVAFVLAYAVSGYGFNPYSQILYRNMAVFLELADLIVIVLMGTMKDVLKKGYYKTFVNVVKHGVIVVGLAVLYLFLLQEGARFSRLTIFFTFVIYVIITYIVRELWIKFLKNKMDNADSRSLLIVCTKSEANTIVNNIRDNNYGGYKISGFAIIDCDCIGDTIEGVKVVANMETAPMYVCQEWIDEVLVVANNTDINIDEMVDNFALTGVTLHLSLKNIADLPSKRQFIEKVGTYRTLTTSMNSASTMQLFLKRLMDIAGGLIGCIMTCIIFIFVAPAIYISSPGPIFFSQERVGKNGKKFKMYKFRSMYMDAEERKAELMKENKLGDGKMFKMDFDPRVIGNKILPNGKKKTGVGNFIRKTSLDEFPQFFNVLKGDMSIVGTRPPLISETNLYELHHKARLAIKPGITGMWQVSGRSEITDFEEVVRLDKEYIDNWNIGLDIKILLKTILVVFKEDGSM